MRLAGKYVGRDRLRQRRAVAGGRRNRESMYAGVRVARVLRGEHEPVAGRGGGPRDRRSGRACLRDEDRDAEAQCDLQPGEVGVRGLRHFLQDQPIAQLARRLGGRAAKRDAHQLRAVLRQREHRRRDEEVASRREPILAVDLLPEHDFGLNQGFLLVVAHRQRG